MSVNKFKRKLTLLMVLMLLFNMLYIPKSFAVGEWGTISFSGPSTVSVTELSLGNKIKTSDGNIDTPLGDVQITSVNNIELEIFGTNEKGKDSPIAGDIKFVNNANLHNMICVSNGGNLTGGIVIQSVNGEKFSLRNLEVINWMSSASGISVIGIKRDQNNVSQEIDLGFYSNKDSIDIQTKTSELNNVDKVIITNDYPEDIGIFSISVGEPILPLEPSKILTEDTTNNSVDNDIEVTFGSDATFEGAVTGVSYNGNALDAGQYVVSSGKVTLKPSVAGNTYLRSPGTGNVVITATGYGNSTVSQTINAGAVNSLEVTTQPVVGSASGDAFATQPVVKLKDQYGNYCTTGVSAGANVVATAKSGTGSWTIGGTSTKAAVGGTATFSDLTCTLTTPGNGAMTFTSGIKTIDSGTFTIPQNAGKTLTADTSDNSVDNDIEVTFAPDATFEGAVTGVSYDGNALDAGQYLVSSGKVTLKPSVAGNTYLRSPGTGNVVITATGYGNSTVSQTINAGAVNSLEVTTQPVVGAASGNAFATQPVVKLKDQYGNYCTTGVSASSNVVATAKSGTGSWTIGGTLTKAAVGGTATFTDLTCTLATPGNGAMTFTSETKTLDSVTFTIPQNAGKTLTADTTSNNVDNDIEVTFASDATFEGAVTGVSYNGNALDSGQYVVSSGKVTLKPSVAGNTHLRTPGTGNVVITATGYGNSTVSQTINAGAVSSLEVTTQPVAGGASGDAFSTQPVVKLKDQYGNYCTTGVSATSNVVATAKSGTGSWTIGGTSTKAAVGGTATFTDLTCTFATPGNGAVTFTSGGKTVDSVTFTIPQNAGKTLTADTSDNSVDNDIEVTFASDATFEGAVTGVSYKGNTLDSGQYVVSSGKVTLKPSVAGNTYLRSPGTGNVVITATGYGDSIVSQTINAGAVSSLEVTTQPLAGAASGDVFATQPIVKLKDQYGNYCTTGVSTTSNVVATAKSGTGSWTIGGTSTKAGVGGTATFTDLTCTFATPGNGAVTFTSGGKTVDSVTFTIPQNAGKTLTADTSDNSVDNDIEVTFASDATFEGAVTGVSYKGNTLDSGQYVVSSGKITLKPSVAGNTYLRSPGTGNVAITATGYGNSTVSQTINAGAVSSLEVTTQPLAGAASGDVFATQPIVKLKDQYGNYCTTGVSATSNVVATAKSGTGSWTIGGTTTKSAISGEVVFSDISVTVINNGTGIISFDCEGKTIDSNEFNLINSSFQVTFETYGGTSITSQNVSYGGYATRPSNPTKTGYVFVDWYSDDIFNNIFDFGVAINSNTTVYAKWNENPVTTSHAIYFDTDGGSPVPTQFVNEGEKVVKPSNPIKSGYTFIGWYKEISKINEFDFDVPVTTSSTIYVKWSKNSSSGGSSSSNNNSNSGTGNQNTNVIINGETFPIGKEEKQDLGNGNTETKVSVEKESVLKQIEEKAKTGQDNVVQIAGKTGEKGILKIGLTGDIVKSLEDKNFDLSIKKDSVDYKIPAKEMTIEKIAKELGILENELEKIEVEVIISPISEALKKSIEEVEKNLNQTEFIVPAINFEIKAKATSVDGKVIETTISQFNQYVERIIEIPDGIDPSKITTGIVFNEDGTFQHVPTVVYLDNGKWYAKINSRSNSSYSVVYNPVKLDTVKEHWSKEAVNDMASRMVIVDYKGFKPDEAITRGEFADYISRALGIYREDEKSDSVFKDVEAGNKYEKSIIIAYKYGIISGYEDDTFRPDKTITREEAMSMFVRAMEITPIKQNEILELSEFDDKSKISSWALKSVEKAISSKIFKGRSSSKIDPQGIFTKAEAGVAIRNLLIESGLINK